MRREYAALFDSRAPGSERWMVMARDPYDYDADYWFVYLRGLSSKEEAERVAGALNRGDER